MEKIKQGTHKAIERRIKLLEKSIEKLKLNIETIKDETDTKVCKHCNTENYHYYAETNNWCCAYC